MQVGEFSGDGTLSPFRGNFSQKWQWRLAGLVGLQNPVTKEVMQAFSNSRKDAMEAWAEERFETEIQNAAALGGIRVLNQIISIKKVEDLI